VCVWLFRTPASPASAASAASAASPASRVTRVTRVLPVAPWSASVEVWSDRVTPRRDTPVSIVVTGDSSVSGLARIPTPADLCFVFAHGAGAGMLHPFMEAVADGLYSRRIATLRYQFPYMERHSRRPDPAPLCHKTVRAAVVAARELMPNLPLFAGGKSFGGRMTSQTQAASPLAGVHGLCFFGFPLHPPKKPSVTRADHLSKVTIPMLFLQGTRDALADLALIQSVVANLPAPVTLTLADQADHSFHVPARSGGTDAQTLENLLTAFGDWAQAVLRGNPRRTLA